VSFTNSNGSQVTPLRPEYIPLEPFLEEQIAWCPPAKSSEDTTLFLITRTGSEEPKILKLQNGQVTPVTVKELPFESTIAPKKKSLLARIRPTSVLTGIGYMVAVVLLAFVVSVNVGYMQARVVLTNSMSGTFEPGDVVVAAPWIEPAVDDIAIYQARDFEGTVRAEFVHRIISGNTETGFEFKGDNNETKDALVVQTEDIKGVVLFWIPNAGSILTPQNLLMGFGVVMFIYFGIGYIRDEIAERKMLRRMRGQGK
jgi:signal peptidase I